MLTVVDGSGNIGFDTSMVTVIDSISPIAITNSATIYLGSNGIAILDSSFIDNGSNDNCGIASFSLSTDTFYCSQAGSQTINYSIVDINGNITNGNENIIILDTISPVANVKDTTVYLDPNGNVIIDSSFVEVNSTDNCGIATIVLSKFTFNCSDEGVNNIIVTIEDYNGNQTQETVNITIRDTLKPTVVAKDTTIYLDASGHFVIDSSFINDGSYDNCQIASINLDSTTFNCSEVGLNTVVLTVFDIYGNSSSTNSFVNVLDTISPVAITKSATVYLNNNGYALIDSSFIDNGSYDNCGILTFNVSPDTLFCPETNIQVNYIITDHNGNVSSGSETFFVLDTISPVANIKDTTVYLDANGSLTIDSSYIDVSS